MKRTLLIILVFIGSFCVTTSTLAQSIEEPNIQSEAAVLVEANTGQILFSKNGDKPMFPASLTKIATAIFTIENANLDDIVTISKNAVETEGTRVYLEEGEKVPLKKLLQGLLINSGNDAGVAIAEYVSGTVDNFSRDINKYLKNVLGVEKTNFTNPHGLFHESHVTTAKDLAKVTKYALENDTFKEIFGTKTLDWNGKSWDTTLRTHHRILKGEIPYDGNIIGGKTGFVNESGYTLATAVEKGNLELIVIILNSFNDNIAYEDTLNLLDYGFRHFKNKTIEKGKIFATGNAEFIVPTKLLYTVPAGTLAKQSIRDDGVLEIKTAEGKLLSSFRLEKKQTNKKMNEINEETTFNNGFSGFIPITLILFVGGILYIYIRKKKSKLFN